jgi:hypothetical protein
MDNGSMSKIVLFLKAHVEGYTRKDGTTVKPHDDRRPGAKHKAGAHVFFPHPKKPGKKALGKFVGERNGKSVVRHDEHGEMEFDHHEVTPARGVPKPADAEATRKAGEYVRLWRPQTRISRPSARPPTWADR